MKLINLWMNIFFFLNSRIFGSKIVGKININQFTTIKSFPNKSFPIKSFPIKSFPNYLCESQEIAGVNPANCKTECNSQYIIKNKKNKVFCEKDKQLYFESNDFIMDKKLISISPGGLKGFYLLGVLSFIKENYPLDDFIFSGASAGAWNSLFMCYKKNSRELILKILNSNSILKAKSVHDMEYALKYKLLELCKDDDFDLQRLFIGVTSLQKYKMVTNIFSDFDNLEDAINCCIASSHIPLITGGFTNRYHDMYTFDGGFSNYPYLNIKEPVLHVTPSMWKEIKESKNKGTIQQMFLYNRFKKLVSFYQLVSENKQTFNFMKLYDDGYSDAKENKKMLDEILIDDYSEI